MLILISSFLGVFVTTCNCLNMLYDSLKRPLKLVLWIGNLSISLFISYALNSTLITQYSTYFILAFTLSIILLNKKNSLINCILFLLGYLLQVTLNYICILLVYILFDINVSSCSFIQSILFMMFYLVLCCLATFHIGKWVRKHLSLEYYTEHKRILIILIIFVVVCASLFIFNFSISEIVGYPPYIIYINCFLFIAYFSLTSILIYCIVQSLRKEFEEKQKITEYEHLQEYTLKLEELYQQMRTFKHDYINILTTLDCYIEQKDLDGLNKYFYTKILPTEKQFSKDTASLGNLKNIQVLELKSIIYQKFIRASSFHLALEIDVPESVKSINYIDSMELSRIMGIFLDNAIEGAAETEEKKLFCGILENDNELTICIANSCHLENIPIEQLYVKGFSTKESGQGIGLYNVKEILKNYPDILHYTKYKDNLFTQELHIPQG